MHDDRLTMIDARPWTAAEQLAIDRFEAQMLDLANRCERPDLMVLGFLQAAGTVMRLQLAVDPTRLPTYAHWIVVFARYVEEGTQLTGRPA